MSAPRSKRATPWHRVPFVWLLVAIPATAVVVGVAMLVIAIISNDGLVVDDYYQRGKEINRELARDRYARENGIHANARFEDAGRRVVVRVSTGGLSPLPPELELRLLHPTRAGHDQTLRLQRKADGSYGSALETPAPGRWLLQIAAPNWRLLSALRIPDDAVITLRPQ